MTVRSLKKQKIQRGPAYVDCPGCSGSQTLQMHSHLQKMALTISLSVDTYITCNGNLFFIQLRNISSLLLWNYFLPFSQIITQIQSFYAIIALIHIFSVVSIRRGIPNG